MSPEEIIASVEVEIEEIRGHMAKHMSGTPSDNVEWNSWNFHLGLQERIIEHAKSGNLTEFERALVTMQKEHRS